MKRLIVLLMMVMMWDKVWGEETKIYTEQYDNGNVKQEYQYYEQSENDEWIMHGRYKSYYENGQTYSEQNFLNGDKHGKCVWFYENGQMASEHMFLNGNRHGEWAWFYEDGTKRIEMTGFENGVEVGQWMDYDEKGNRRNGNWKTKDRSMEGNSVNGVREGRYVFSNGWIMNYKDGRRHGNIREQDKDGNWTYTYWENGKIPPWLALRKRGRVTTEKAKFGKNILLTYYAPPYFSLDAVQNVGFVLKFSADVQRRLSRRSSTGLKEADELTKELLTQVVNKTRQSQKTPVTTDTTNADFVISIVVDEFVIRDQNTTTTIRYKQPYVNDPNLSDAEQMGAALAHSIAGPKKTTIAVIKRECSFGITVSAEDMYTRKTHQLFSDKFLYTDMTTEDSRAGPELRAALPDRDIWAREQLDHTAYFISGLFVQKEVTKTVSWAKECKKTMKVGPNGKRKVSHCLDAYNAMRTGHVSTARNLLEDLEAGLLEFEKDRKKKAGKDKLLAATYYLNGILEEANNHPSDAKVFYEQAITAISKEKESKKEKFRNQIARVDSLIDELSQWKQVPSERQERRIAYSNELLDRAQAFADSQKYVAAVDNAQRIDSRFISMDRYTDVETFISKYEPLKAEEERARAEEEIREREAKVEREREEQERQRREKGKLRSM